MCYTTFYQKKTHKKMNTNIIFNSRPKFETKFYLKKRTEIIVKYDEKIKNSNSFLAKFKIWISLQIELLKFSPLINLYFGKYGKN